jgi:hypothetical protein
VSPTDVSPTENSWMLRLLNKASLRFCAHMWSRSTKAAITKERIVHGTEQPRPYVWGTQRSGTLPHVTDGSMGSYGEKSGGLACDKGLLDEDQ